MSNGTPDHGHGPDEPPEHDTIEIGVITTADDLDRTYNLNEPLRPVFEQALSLVGGHAQADQFILEFGDVELTDLDAKLGDLKQHFGWGDTVELQLVPRPVVV